LDAQSRQKERDKQQREEINRFVNQINAVGRLVSTRSDTLVNALTAFLRKEESRSDTQLVHDMESLSIQIEDLRDQISSKQNNPETASRVQAALSGDMGDHLARLQLDKAAQTLDAIGVIDKKIDTLTTIVTCNAATPEALANAIKGFAADHVIANWRCRPENTVNRDVQTAFVLLFTSQQFPAAKPFLDQLVAGGFNPFKEIRPLEGPLPSDPHNEAGWLLVEYFYKPVLRPLSDGNLAALQWIIANAPPGYWSTYGRLMEDMKKIMRLPYAPFPPQTGAQAISMLRKAGVPADTHDYLAFRDVYQNWLQLQVPAELKEPLVRPTGAARVFAQQMNSFYPSTAPPASSADVWGIIAAALAPDSPTLLREEKSRVATDMTAGDLKAIEQRVELLTNQLSHRTWYRKLPETPATIQEARRRQALDAFDSYGYVPVAVGDLQDIDLLPSGTRAPVGYPSCDCYSARHLRNQLAEVNHRKDSLVQFRNKYSN
jgi:hypothetical protein